MIWRERGIYCRYIVLVSIVYFWMYCKVWHDFCSVSCLSCKNIDSLPFGLKEHIWTEFWYFWCWKCVWRQPVPFVNTLKLSQNVCHFAEVIFKSISCLKALIFLCELHWNLLAIAQLTQKHHLFRQWRGHKQAIDHYQKQWYHSLLTQINIIKLWWVNHFRAELIFRNVSMFAISTISQHSESSDNYNLSPYKTTYHQSWVYSYMYSLMPLGFFCCCFSYLQYLQYVLKCFRIQPEGIVIRYIYWHWIKTWRVG